jgi:hydrogenase-4 component F
MSVFVILLVPLIAAALICIPATRNIASGVTIVSSVTTFILAIRIGWLVSAGRSVTDGLNAAILNWVAVDGLSALILVLIALVGLTAAIFSVGYLAHKELERKRLLIYYVNYNLFIFSMLAIPVMAEPTLVWIVVELTTLCSALLVSFENTPEALEAAWKYVVLSLMGAAMALFGFLVLFAAMQATGGGVYTWAGLAAAAPSMPSVLLQTAFLLILIGLGTKAGLVPMHTWLPDAHSQAPSPVCALLSGIETTTILYVILRLFPVMRAAPNSHAEAWALVLGLISVGVAAFLLLQVRDYKRMFAFSTVEHMGIILTAVGLGASAAGYGAMQEIIQSFDYQVVLLLRSRRRSAGCRHTGNREGARTHPQIPSRQRRARFWRACDYGRSAACGFFKRISHFQGGFGSETLSGDGFARSLHRYCVFRGDAAHQPDGVWRARR